MDVTDLNLSRLLLLNSRTSFRELADKLDLSVPAVHTRIQTMQHVGVIKTFTAKVSLAYLGAPTVNIFGPSQAPDPAEVSERLGEEEHTYWVTVAGGNFLYVGGYLRDYGELDAYAAFVTKEAEMPNATVGLMPPPPLPPKKGEPFRLDRLDYRILKALAKDSRRPVTEVAEQVGASAKTTARHVERMANEGAVEFSIEWYPDASDDIVSTFHLRLKPGRDKYEAMAHMMNRYAADLLFVFPFSNLPAFLIAACWTNSMKGLKELRARLQGEPAFESVMANVLQTGQIFDTWRDALVIERAGSKAPAS